MKAKRVLIFLMIMALFMSAFPMSTFAADAVPTPEDAVTAVAETADPAPAPEQAEQPAPAAQPEPAAQAEAAEEVAAPAAPEVAAPEVAAAEEVAAPVGNGDAVAEADITATGTAVVTVGSDKVTVTVSQDINDKKSTDYTVAGTMADNFTAKTATAVSGDNKKLELTLKEANKPQAKGDIENSDFTITYTDNKDKTVEITVSKITAEPAPINVNVAAATATVGSDQVTVEATGDLKIKGSGSYAIEGTNASVIKTSGVTIADPTIDSGKTTFKLTLTSGNATTAGDINNSAFNIVYTNEDGAVVTITVAKITVNAAAQPTPTPATDSATGEAVITLGSDKVTVTTSKALKALGTGKSYTIGGTYASDLESTVTGDPTTKKFELTLKADKKPTAVGDINSSFTISYTDASDAVVTINVDKITVVGAPTVKKAEVNDKAVTIVLSGALYPAVNSSTPAYELWTEGATAKLADLALHASEANTYTATLSETQKADIENAVLKYKDNSATPVVQSLKIGTILNVKQTAVKENGAEINGKEIVIKLAGPLTPAPNSDTAKAAFEYWGTTNAKVADSTTTYDPKTNTLKVTLKDAVASDPSAITNAVIKYKDNLAEPQVRSITIPTIKNVTQAAVSYAEVVNGKDVTITLAKALNPAQHTNKTIGALEYWVNGDKVDGVTPSFDGTKKIITFSLKDEATANITNATIKYKDANSIWRELNPGTIYRQAKVVSAKVTGKSVVITLDSALNPAAASTPACKYYIGSTDKTSHATEGVDGTIEYKADDKTIKFTLKTAAAADIADVSIVYKDKDTTTPSALDRTLKVGTIELVAPDSDKTVKASVKAGTKAVTATVEGEALKATDGTYSIISAEVDGVVYNAASGDKAVTKVIDPATATLANKKDITFTLANIAYNTTSIKNVKIRYQLDVAGTYGILTIANVDVTPFPTQTASNLSASVTEGAKLVTVKYTGTFTPDPKNNSGYDFKVVGIKKNGNPLTLTTDTVTPSGKTLTFNLAANAAAGDVYSELKILYTGTVDVNGTATDVMGLIEVPEFKATAVDKETSAKVIKAAINAAGNKITLTLDNVLDPAPHGTPAYAISKLKINGKVYNDSSATPAVTPVVTITSGDYDAMRDKLELTLNDFVIQKKTIDTIEELVVTFKDTTNADRTITVPVDTIENASTVEYTVPTYVKSGTKVETASGATQYKQIIIELNNALTPAMTPADVSAADTTHFEVKGLTFDGVAAKNPQVVSYTSSTKILKVQVDRAIKHEAKISDFEIVYKSGNATDETIKITGADVANDSQSQPDFIALPSLKAKVQTDGMSIVMNIPSKLKFGANDQTDANSNIVAPATHADLEILSLNIDGVDAKDKLAATNAIAYSYSGDTITVTFKKAILKDVDIKDLKIAAHTNEGEVTVWAPIVKNGSTKQNSNVDAYSAAVSEDGKSIKVIIASALDATVVADPVPPVPANSIPAKNIIDVTGITINGKDGMAMVDDVTVDEHREVFTVKLKNQLYKDSKVENLEITFKGNTKPDAIITAKTVDIPAAAPSSVVTNLKGKVSNANNIVLTWDAVAGAKGYQVYNTNAKKVVATTDKTTATMTKLAYNTSYGYQVRALLDDGRTGAYSTPATVTTDPATPGKVTTVTVKATDCDKMSISWKATSNANLYRVEQSTNGKTYAKVADVTRGTSFTKTGLKASTTYYYRVTAINKVGSKEMKAAVSSAKAAKTLSATPAKVTGLKASNSAKGKALVTWKAVTGADRYVVYTSANNGKTFDKGVVVTGTKLTKSVKKGATYTFKVCAQNKYNGKYYTGAASSVAKVKITK